MNSQYEISITQDGSPTLLCARPTGQAEKMHHSGGALSESFFIYHQALGEVLQRHWPLKILSLGLGLGYNEWIALGEIFKNRPRIWKLWSFEADHHLRQEFQTWLFSPLAEDPLHSAWTEVFTQVSAKMEIPAPELKNFARRSHEQKQWEHRQHFPIDSSGVEGCTCIFYDAFSKKMDPDLWFEETLVQDLKKISGPHCVLATYAATGTLNRALNKLGFRLIPKKGFLGKRESTLAIREDIR
jgi:tRNA U34 5-methylaminomethyl-2-thiouridine-forming methyltransferase MnmC